MKEFKYTITDPEGIHARPAGELVKVCKEFACKITLTKDGKTADCKKIFGLMSRRNRKLLLHLMEKMKMQHIPR